MKNKHILVTGGAGSIGSELVRQLSLENQVYFIDTNETPLFDLYEELRQSGLTVVARVGDVRNAGVFEDILREFGQPEYIFHASAYKHVTPSTWSPDEYISTNITGTLNVLKFAARYGIRVINISTDKVVHSNSVMGATKKVAEIMTRDAGQISVRFGNVMGSRGSVIPIWQKQIDENKPLTVTDPSMERYMMTIPSACSLIIDAVEIGKPGDIIILEMGNRVNVLDLAKQVLREAGRTDIEIKMIGARPGETLDEKLLTPDEEKSVIKEGKYLILR